VNKAHVKLAKANALVRYQEGAKRHASKRKKKREVWPATRKNAESPDSDSSTKKRETIRGTQNHQMV